MMEFAAIVVAAFCLGCLARPGFDWWCTVSDRWSCKLSGTHRRSDIRKAKHCHHCGRDLCGICFEPRPFHINCDRVKPERVR